VKKTYDYIHHYRGYWPDRGDLGCQFGAVDEVIVEGLARPSALARP
jgi:hypothetical protein